MTKKSTKLTAHPAVKIVSFTLIIALAFLMMNRIYAVENRNRETGVSTDIVLTDISTNQYFANRNIGNAVYLAAELAYYGSEAAIIDGDFLQWTTEYNYVYENGYGYSALGTSLTTPGAYYYYEWLEERFDTPERREQEEQRAIRQQLDSFRRAMEYIVNSEGLIFYITDPAGNVISNTNADADWFKSQPVYYVADGVSRSETASEHVRNYYYFPNAAPHWERGEDRKIFLAFTAEFVSAQNSFYYEVQRAYVTDFVIAGVAAILCLALVIVLLLGAGRKRSGEGVHFAAIDKPYLDISLAVVIVWLCLIILIALDYGRQIWRYQNHTAMSLLFAAVSVTAAPPILLWLLSLAKRIKAGRFWRHTLIYYLPCRFGRFLKSLWPGFPMIVKVALIAGASLFLMLFVGYRYYTYSAILWALFFTALVTFFLMRYARRIRMLEEAARKTSGGAYDVVIDVGKGELGSIANSINNISAGINIAVEQRMKSERLKTELITNVSHDIRTPLTSIITYTDLLKHEGLDCEKAGEYLDILIQKSQRLKTLTDELFEAAKAATGNIEVHIAELDLVSLINQVLGELEGAIKSSGLDLRVTLPSTLPVLADGKLMWRVMENLLSNVFKYSLPGSRVYLEARLDYPHVCIELKNISARELNIDPDELTERFKRGDDSRSDGGSGLGLSIVQSFVAAQGGKFNISIDGDLFKASVQL